MKKAGQPTKYKPEYCEGIIKYFDVEPYTINDDGSIEVCDLPNLYGYAGSINVVRETLHEWCKTHTEFSVAYKQAKEIQAKILLTNSLRGLYTTAPAIFAMKNLMAWTDAQTIVHQGEVTHTHVKKELGYDKIEEKRKQLKLVKSVA